MSGQQMQHNQVISLEDQAITACTEHIKDIERIALHGVHTDRDQVVAMCACAALAGVIYRRLAEIE